MRGYVLGLSLLLAGCSSTTATPDLRPADLSLGESRSDRSSLDLRRDLAPDQPRPPASWKTVPGASLKLTEHTLTSLANGDVLIVGGATEDGSGTGKTLHQTKAYRFLAAQGTLVEAGELKLARAEHRAVLLADGRVLILGGVNASTDFLSSVEIYDPGKPASSAWTEGPAMLEGLADFDAIRIPSGEVMVSGGRRDNLDSLASVSFFQPSSSSWKITLTTLTTKRRQHASVLLKDGKVLITGGLQGLQKKGEGNYLSSMELFNPTNGGTAPIAKAMSKERAGHAMHLLADGRIAILGGFCGNNCTGTLTHDLYDLGTDAVTPVPSVGFFPSQVSTVKLLDGRVLLLANDPSEAAVIAFNPNPGASLWSTLPQPAQPRFYSRAALLKDGAVLVVGGMQDNATYTYSDKVERFYP